MNWDQIERKWAAMTRRVQVGWERPLPKAQPQTDKSKITTGTGAIVSADRRAARRIPGSNAASPK